MSNQNLCQAMRQLVSLLKQADSLFADLEVRAERGCVVMVIITSRLSAPLSLDELMLFKSGSDTWTQRLQNSTPRKPRYVST